MCLRLSMLLDRDGVRLGGIGICIGTEAKWELGRCMGHNDGMIMMEMRYGIDIPARAGLINTD